MVWKIGIFSLKGLAAGMNVGRSQSEMVRPITHPFARHDKTAIIIERTPTRGFPSETAGLNRKWTMTARTALPSMISGMIPGTALITGEAAMKNAVTGVMTERMMPQVSPHVITANMMHRLTMGPVI